MNERNASSPRKRLVLNSVKREENRVPLDSNEASLGAGTYGQATNTRLNCRHRKPAYVEYRLGPKGQGLGLGISESDPGSPPQNPADSVALRVRQTKVRNEVTPAASRKSRCQPDDNMGKSGTQHPTPAGTYLAAAVLFRTMFNASSARSTYYGGLPNEIALRLQGVAKEIPILSPR